MTDPLIGTQVGVDGKRHAIGSLPTLHELFDLVPQKVRVYGSPDDGAQIVFSNGKAVWTAPSGGISFATYDDAVLSDSPVSYLQFADAAGAGHLADSIGVRTWNVQHGSANTAPGLFTPGPPLGSALGSSMAGSVAANGTYQVTTHDTTAMPTGALSVETWFSPSISQGFPIFSFSDDSGNNVFFDFQGDGSGGLTASLTATGGLSASSSVPDVLGGVVGHHVVLVIGVSTVTLYVDGVLVDTQIGDFRASSVLTGPINSASLIAVYAPTDPASSVGPFAIYPSALTAGKILAHYNAGK